MACASEPLSIDLCRRRGDSFADQFTLKDASGTAINITGFSFTLTVDPSSEPSDALNNLFALTGTITDAPGGVVEFAPTPVQSDVTPQTYFYDIQQTDGGGAIRTIVTGQYVITQDITK